MPAKKKTVKKGIKKAAKSTAKKAAKKAVKKVAKKAAKKVAKKATKKVAKKAAKKVAKKAAKKVAKKAAKKVAKKATKKVAKKSASKAPKKAQQKATSAKTGTSVKKTTSTTAKKVVKKATKPVTESQAKGAPKKKKLVEIDYAEFQENLSARTTAGPLEFNPYQLNMNEEYMNDIQIEHFKKILSDWRMQLMTDVDTTVGHLQRDAEAYADPLDRAAQEEGFNLELRTRDRERKLLKKIEQALDWIDEGVYGYCEDCGADIGVRRLEARPTAAKCIDCKTYAEIREKQVGDA